MVNLRLWSEKNPFISKSQISFINCIGRGDPRGDHLGKTVHSSRTGNYLEESLQKEADSVLRGVNGSIRSWTWEVVAPVGYCVQLCTWCFQNKSGHRNDKEVVFAKLCGKRDMSGSVYAKWRETQKRTRHSSVSMSQVVMKRMMVSYSLWQGGQGIYWDFFKCVSDSLCINPEGWSITTTLIAIDLPAFSACVYCVNHVIS